MDKKAYRDRLRSQDKRERTAASLGLPYSGRDLAIAFGLYLAAVLLCLFLRNIDLHRDTSYVAVIFLLDVFLTAYWTNGYILGIITAVAGVFSVDYIFTYPYWHISFTLTGFPLTFLVMMTISVLTAAVTSRAKQTETVRREAENRYDYGQRLQRNRIFTLGRNMRNFTCDFLSNMCSFNKRKECCLRRKGKVFIQKDFFRYCTQRPARSIYGSCYAFKRMPSAPQG